MPVQTGGLCYADAANAAPSACAAFVPVSSINGTNLITVGCTLGNVDGTLSMYRSTADMSTAAAPVVTSFTQTLHFSPCTEGELLDAFRGIASPVLALIFTSWGLWMIYRLLTQHRGEAS